MGGHTYPPVGFHNRIKASTGRLNKAEQEVGRKRICLEVYSVQLLLFAYSPHYAQQILGVAFVF